MADFDPVEEFVKVTIEADGTEKAESDLTSSMETIKNRWSEAFSLMEKSTDIDTLYESILKVGDAVRSIPGVDWSTIFGELDSVGDAIDPKQMWNNLFEALRKGLSTDHMNQFVSDFTSGIEEAFRDMEMQTGPPIDIPTSEILDSITQIEKALD